MEHPFAKYIQMLGKGQHGSRDLTQDEARDALKMILAHEAEPIQLGAFLMLMRVKEETGPEVAGFALAAQASLKLPAGLPAIALDWASYAGKRRQLPYYLLAALLLASHKIPVLMHGIGHAVEGRLYVPEALRALGLTPSATIDEALDNIARKNFAYLPLEVLSADLARMLDLKDILGLRSPIHTIVRMLNPFKAEASLMGIFHPGYDDTHQEAAALMGMKGLAVFKGEGGEAERNPDAACTVKFLLSGQPVSEEWPALFDKKHLKVEAMRPEELLKLWRGELADEYGEAAVTGTAAIALRALGRADSPAAAQKLAEAMWAARDRGYL